jgi:DNA-binding SARP family transcriptional activator/predicted ATPase
MMMLEVNLLGMPVVYWRATRVIFPFAKLEGLLYYLLLQKKATRHELAALLWSDIDEAAAKKNLRNALYLLKKLIVDDIVLTPTRTVVLLNPKIVVECDVERFSANIGRDGIDLYCGDFLSGFILKDAQLLEEWIVGQRDYFKELYSSRLKKLIISLLSTKDNREAKHYIKCLIKIDEYNERSYRILMKFYEKEGAFNKAFEVYHKLTEKLVKELGIQPDAETRQLYQRIQCRKAEGKVQRTNSNSELFFGRERELNRLRFRIQSFIAGAKSSFVALNGEQGVGKTALMGRLFNSVSLGSAVFLEAQCYQAEEKFPFKPWNAIFRKITDLLRQQEVKLPVLWKQVISYIFPSMADSEVFSFADPIINLEVMNYYMIEEVISGVLSKVAGANKIIIFFEDIQWIDDNSLLLLKNLILNNTGKFMVIATCRNDYVKKLDVVISQLERNGLLERLLLNRFTEQEVEEFSARMLPVDKVTPQLVKILYKHTEGNALFLVEYFKLIHTGQDINKMPPRIHSILQDRIMSVSEQGQKVLNIASLFFDEVNFEQLIFLGNVDEMELIEVLEELQEQQLLWEFYEQDYNKPVYRFSHSKIRDFVYSQLLVSRKRVLHNRVGMFIEGKLRNNFRDRGFYATILYHFSNAGNKLKVLEYTIKTAEEYSYVNHELFPQVSDNYLYTSESLCMDQMRATEYLQEIASMISCIKDEDGMPEQLKRLEVAYLEMLGRYYIWQAEYRRGIRTIHRMINLAASIANQDYLLKGYQQIVYYGIQTNHASIIQRFADKIMKMAQELNVTEKVGTALRFLGVAHSVKREYPIAEKYYRRSISLFKRLEDGQNNYSLSIAAAYNYIGDIRRFNKNFSEAIVYYEQAIELCCQKNIFKGLPVFYINAGHAALDMGKDCEAKRYLADAIHVSERLGGHCTLRGHCTLNSLLALVAVKESRPYQALVYLRKADECAIKLKDDYQTGLVIKTKAQIRAIMQDDKVLNEVLKDYLPLSVQDYCVLGKAVFLRRLGKCYEIDILDSICRQALS